MHRKSLEAAEHLKEQENCNSNSDHEDTTSTRTQASDTSSTTNNNNTTTTTSQQLQQHDKDPQQSQPYPDDPEAFRNNSIACLRAKAQEHSAKLMIRAQHDANANNLQQQQQQQVVEAGGGGVFWQRRVDNWGGCDEEWEDEGFLVVKAMAEGFR